MTVHISFLHYRVLGRGKENASQRWQITSQTGEWTIFLGWLHMFTLILVQTLTLSEQIWQKCLPLPLNHEKYFNTGRIHCGVFFSFNTAEGLELRCFFKKSQKVISEKPLSCCITAVLNKRGRQRSLIGFWLSKTTVSVFSRHDCSFSSHQWWQHCWWRTVTGTIEEECQSIPF